MKIADILRHRIDCIPLRIDRNKDSGERLCLGIETVEPMRDVGQRGGADLRAPGEAEEDERRLADQRLRPDRLPLVVGQREVHGGQRQRAPGGRGGLRRAGAIDLPPAYGERGRDGTKTESAIRQERAPPHQSAGPRAAKPRIGTSIEASAPSAKTSDRV